MHLVVTTCASVLVSVYQPDILLLVALRSLHGSGSFVVIQWNYTVQENYFVDYLRCLFGYSTLGTIDASDRDCL